jgi:hypothetical protein
MNCAHLTHPFQNDAGVSQQARAAAELLSAAPKIDGRTLADLLDYFQQLSRNVNFYQYDEDSNKLIIGDWQPFFKKSLPFVLTGIIKYNPNPITRQLEKYNKLFARRSSAKSLQLVLHFIYHKTIYPINDWSRQLADSELQVKGVLEKLIKDKLAGPVKQFICLANTAADEFKVKSPNFTGLSRNSAWQLQQSDLLKKTGCFTSTETTRRKRLVALHKKIIDLAPLFLESIRLAGTAAGLGINASLEPVKEELKEKHPPHLALLFAFLKLFENLQNDLNGFTRKHLDFFYREVLKLKARNAVPDRAHILLEIQTQLANHALGKGTKLKAGKDEKKAEMVFASDDEIVINQAKIADVKTLFLNNRIIHNKTYAEGIYMAPNALTADGIKIDFKEEPKSWPTVGARLSKYVDPEKKLFRQYPNGRTGFALASPVFLMREGTRTVDITLVCELDPDICFSTPTAAQQAAKNCCEGVATSTMDSETGVRFWESGIFANKVSQQLNKKYYHVTIYSIDEAIKKGLSRAFAEKLREKLKVAPDKKLCYCPLEDYEEAVVLEEDNWNQFLSNNPPAVPDGLVLNDIFKPQRVFDISLSGEKGWVKPAIKSITFTALQNNKYALGASFELSADEQAIIGADAAILGEQLGTTKPVVKFELNDFIKLQYTAAELLDKISADEPCCLERQLDAGTFYISYYHFLKNLTIVSSGQTASSTDVFTLVEVTVTGIRKFLAENDDGVQDPAGSITVFGTRPKIGSSFYIGSGEIFSKNWQRIVLNGEWKNHPQNLEEYYKFYNPRPKNEDFKIDSAVLESGDWKLDGEQPLFDPPPGTIPTPGWENHTYSFTRTLFTGSSYQPGKAAPADLSGRVGFARHGFLRLTLKGQDFRHEVYAFELARQLMKLAGLVDPVSIGNARTKLLTIETIINSVKLKITAINGEAQAIKLKVDHLVESLTRDDAGPTNPATDGLAVLINAFFGFISAADAALPADPATAETNINDAVLLMPAIAARLIAIAADVSDINNAFLSIDQLLNHTTSVVDPNSSGVVQLLQEVSGLIASMKVDLEITSAGDVGIPLEPYTPAFRQLVIDYDAIAEINDIDLIHLYPYPSTYKAENMEKRPALLPTFCNEGHLFLGLDKFVPGSTLNILFKLAEATADSESPEQPVLWHYLDNNVWKPLRNGLEILNDQTDDLTTSGIIRFALPENMTTGNTIMPPNYHWIRASIEKNSGAVAETLGIFTQAISATFVPDAQNDLLRLGQPLAAGTINRLDVADPAIKLLTQPFESFGGQVPEIENNFYVRVAELLRHKGRAIQRWDYERLALEAFPQVFKAKCITHSFGLNAHQYINDFPMAPGYVLLAVIPDLNKLNAARSFQPKLPVSILLKIEDYLKKRTSPFVRLKVMNPRYEEVDFCIKAKLTPGSDPVYYKEVMMQDLREFMAPWAIGEYEKLRFGQCINRSDVIQFLESRQYLDHIIDLKMALKQAPAADFSTLPADMFEVCPLTPRSILIAGDIDVCIPEPTCDEYSNAQPCANKPIMIYAR